MKWRGLLRDKPGTEPRYIQGVTREEFDAFMNDVEGSAADLKKIHELLPRLEQTVKDLRKAADEANKAKSELESTIATSRRFKRSGW